MCVFWWVELGSVGVGEWVVVVECVLCGGLGGGVGDGVGWCFRGYF